MPENISPDITEIILKRLTGTITESESRRLDDWVAADTSGRRAALLEILLDKDELTREYRQRDLAGSGQALREMQARIHIARAPLRRRRAIIAAAASVAVILCSALWYIGRDTSLTPPPVAATGTSSAVSPATIKPGITKAVLWQSSGTAIPLGANDPIASGNNFPASRQDICLTSPEELCLEVPRGGEFKIILEDSTVVWLNSESTLRYPETFTPGERRVEVTGEAYFAVRKDENRPFYVEHNGLEIKVYGTTFNVRSYPDDDNSSPTLASGSISLRKPGRQSAEIHLSPGHQAIFNKEDSTLTMTTVNPEVITGWRHGRFVFEGQTLLTIMQDLARWYNFKFEFTDPALATIKFNGNIPRYADFNTAITILENCGDISFGISGNKVTISQLK